MTAENRRWKERAAGAWASCILIDKLPTNGIQEGVVPTFSGWLQNYYLQEKTITISQDDRGVSGKSSWSNLFARMDIKAADLDIYGGLKRLPAPTRKHGLEGNNLWIRPLRPALGDALFENGGISYGFSAAEFAALIILCGFCPGDFASQNSQHSTSYFGQIQVAEYGQFAQVERFDSHHGFRDAIRSFKTDMRDVPVAHCLNLAFGIIPIRGRGGREWVIPRDCTTESDACSHEIATDIWSGYAVPHQLIRIRYSFERFAGTSQLDVADYAQSNEAFEAEDIRILQDLMSSGSFGPVSQLSESKNFAAKAREVLNTTHAIAAIQPWALEPVLPAHMRVAMRSILDPFYRTREFTITVLQSELKMIAHETFRPEGRTGDELLRLINITVGDKDNFFGDSFRTSIYHEAMSMVFHHKNIKLEEVRISLAAAVGSRLFWRGEGVPENGPFRENLRLYLERCYPQAGSTDKPRKVPGWAVDIYANYFWGWITVSKPADPDLISYFRRRVFLA